MWKNFWNIAFWNNFLNGPVHVLFYSRPFSQLFTADRAFRACVAIIIVSCISVSPGLEVMHFEKNTFCEQKSSFIVRVLHVFYMSIFIAMFSIVGFCYARVAFTIKHRLMRKTNSAQPLPPGPTNSSTTNSKKTLKGIPHFRCWNRVSPATEESMLREQMKESIRRSTSDAVANGESKQDASCEMKNTTAAGSSDLRRSTFINTYAAHPKAKINNRARPEIDMRKDRTTKIMFAVTLVFIFSWVPTWSVFVYYALGGYRDPTRQNVILLFGEKLYMVNTFMNPFFYISMSSTFQRRTQIVLRSLTNCKKLRAHWFRTQTQP